MVSQVVIGRVWIDRYARIGVYRRYILWPKSLVAWALGCTCRKQKQRALGLANRDTDRGFDTQLGLIFFFFCFSFLDE